MADATPAPADPSQATPPAAPAAPAGAAPAVPATPPQAQPTLLGDPPKAGEGTPSTPAPEEVKVKFPEGIAADDPLVAEFMPMAKDLGLKSEGAQKLVDLYAKSVQAAQTRHMEQVTQWAEESRQAFGAEFDATLSAAKKALDRIAPPGFKELLVKTGLGNHKDVIKTFAQMGKLISEDRLPGGSGGGTAEPTRDDLVKEAFPNSPSMWSR